MEIEQIKEYQVFKDFGKAVYEKNKITNAPEGHQKNRVHFVFDVKHCGKFKARLVADGHLTKEPMETVYSGVVSIRNLRLAMFLAEIKTLELWGADVGNTYLQALTREKLYIVGGPELKLKGVGPINYHLGCGYTRDEDGTLVADPRKMLRKYLSLMKNLWRKTKED